MAPGDQDDPAPPEFSSIVAGPSGFVAASDKAGGSPLMYSTDGETWKAASISVADGYALTVATYKLGFVATGNDPTRAGHLDGLDLAGRPHLDDAPRLAPARQRDSGLRHRRRARGHHQRLGSRALRFGIRAASAPPSASASASASATAKPTPKPTAKPTATPSRQPPQLVVVVVDGRQVAADRASRPRAATGPSSTARSSPWTSRSRSTSNWIVWSSADGKNWQHPASPPAGLRRLEQLPHRLDRQPDRRRRLGRRRASSRTTSGSFASR